MKFGCSFYVDIYFLFLSNDANLAKKHFFHIQELWLYSCDFRPLNCKTELGSIKYEIQYDNVGFSAVAAIMNTKR